MKSNKSVKESGWLVSLNDKFLSELSNGNILDSEIYSLELKQEPTDTCRKLAWLCFSAQLEEIIYGAEQRNKKLKESDEYEFDTFLFRWVKKKVEVKE